MARVPVFTMNLFKPVQMKIMHRIYCLFIVHSSITYYMFYMSHSVAFQVGRIIWLFHYKLL